MNADARYVVQTRFGTRWIDQEGTETDDQDEARVLASEIWDGGSGSDCRVWDRHYREVYDY